MTLIRAKQIMLDDPAHRRHRHDDKYRNGSAFIGGKFVSIDDAGVPITDLGFTQSDGAYDVVSASKGLIFRLDDHLDRFASSCEKFRLENPYSRIQTIEILKGMVKLAGFSDAYIYWAVTRGPMPDGVDRINSKTYKNRFYGFVVPYVYIADDDLRAKGLSLMVSRKYVRIPAKSVDPTAKNMHWMDLKLSMFEAHDNGHDWSVLCDADGYLAESPGANIFFFKQGSLYTPESGCLEGITRKTAMELATELGIPVETGRFHLDELVKADEAFITSTGGGILPIDTVDGHTLRGGSTGAGQLTTKMHNLYWTKRWDGWLGTPVDYDNPIVADQMLIQTG
jgi:branched-chain amino acid aminotransferase